MAETSRGKVVDRRAAELGELGIPAGQAEAWLQSQEVDESEGGDTQNSVLPMQESVHGPLHIWPDNWPVFRLFMALQTQWRTTATLVALPNQAGITSAEKLQGLNYTAVPVVMDLLRLKKRKRLFGQLQEMERAVLEAWDGRQH